MLTTVSDIREIERRPHHVELVAEFRAPAGGPWLPLLVDITTGTVSFGDLNVFPGRTCKFRAMLTGTDGQNVLAQGLSVFGAWVRLSHRITRNDQTTFAVPLGYFRVQALTVEPLTGAVTVDGNDAGITLN